MSNATTNTESASPVVDSKHLRLLQKPKRKRKTSKDSGKDLLNASDAIAQRSRRRNRNKRKHRKRNWHRSNKDSSKMRRKLNNFVPFSDPTESMERSVSFSMGLSHARTTELRCRPGTLQSTNLNYSDIHWPRSSRSSFLQYFWLSSTLLFTSKKLLSRVELPQLQPCWSLTQLSYQRFDNVFLPHQSSLSSRSCSMQLCWAVRYASSEASWIEAMIHKNTITSGERIPALSSASRCLYLYWLLLSLVSSRESCKSWLMLKTMRNSTKKGDWMWGPQDNRIGITRVEKNTIPIPTTYSKNICLTLMSLSEPSLSLRGCGYGDTKRVIYPLARRMILSVTGKFRWPLISKKCITGKCGTSFVLTKNAFGSSMFT